MKTIFGIFLLFIILFLTIKYTTNKKEGFDTDNTFDLIIQKINFEIDNSKNNKNKTNALKDALNYTNYIKYNLF